MNKLLLSVVLILQSYSMIGQQNEKLSIFENHKNWRREVIEFPIDWAPDVKLNGFEELLFSPSWSKPKSDGFWSLMIGWKIETSTPLTLEEIERNFKAYFDGLMKPNHWAKEFPEPEVHFKKQQNNFSGSMTFFDGFHTGKVITVNIKTHQFICKEKNKVIVSFQISPKELTHAIWQELDMYKLKKDTCN